MTDGVLLKEIQKVSCLQCLMEDTGGVECHTGVVPLSGSVLGASAA